MFDPSKLTILVQAAGGSGDWRMWHYVVADDDTKADLAKPGYFDGGGMREHITPHSLVYAVAIGYVAQYVLVKDDNGSLTALLMSAVDLPAGKQLPHVQGVPNQPDGNQSIDQANKPNTEA